MAAQLQRRRLWLENLGWDKLLLAQNFNLCGQVWETSDVFPKLQCLWKPPWHPKAPGLRGASQPAASPSPGNITRRGCRTACPTYIPAQAQGDFTNKTTE